MMELLMGWPLPSLLPPPSSYCNCSNGTHMGTTLISDDIHSRVEGVAASPNLDVMLGGSSI
jgi:hypothetical protein